MQPLAPRSARDPPGPMRNLLLIDVVGLAWRHVGEHTPHLRRLAQEGFGAPMDTILPAVTCSAQATMLTGLMPSEHGAVGNGWYFDDVGEVLFWRQSNACVRGEKIYETLAKRAPKATCAKLFWWWNMGAAVDRSITPRPFYPADGRKLLAVYGQPTQWCAGVESELGPFPFFDFWGPKAGLGSSRWIADATRLTIERERPTLTLCYLPHLDYDHQRFGPDSPQGIAALREVDALVGELVECARANDTEVVVVSEYAIEDVTRDVALNRDLRRAGLLEVRETPVGDVLDVFASRAFAVADHQVAHVYVKDASDLAATRAVLESIPGVERVLDRDEQRAFGIDHARSGQLVAISEADAWFSYYYWLDEANAPDFAPTVDIHRKPGYDPAELFVDPKLRAPMVRVASRLARKKLGFRYLMDVIPTNGEQVRGSHGRLPASAARGPVFLSTLGEGDVGGAPSAEAVAMTSVKERVLGALLAE
jgi:predicted AlkP superfamily pyrophosphatase or phosphodiesterase